MQFDSVVYLLYWHSRNTANLSIVMSIHHLIYKIAHITTRICKRGINQFTYLPFMLSGPLYLSVQFSISGMYDFILLFQNSFIPEFVYLMKTVQATILWNLTWDSTVCRNTLQGSTSIKELKKISVRLSSQNPLQTKRFSEIISAAQKYILV